MVVVVDGTFLVLPVQCSVGLASLLAEQASQLTMVSGNNNYYGQFRQYNFCSRLSHVFFRARAARVMQKLAHNSRHSTLPIPTIAVNPMTFL